MDRTNGQDVAVTGIGRVRIGMAVAAAVAVATVIGLTAAAGSTEGARIGAPVPRTPVVTTGATTALPAATTTPPAPAATRAAPPTSRPPSSTPPVVAPARPTATPVVRERTPTGPPVTCTWSAARLPVGDALGGQVTGTDGGQQLAGSLITAPAYGDYRAALWRDGELAFTAAEVKSRAHDVNRAGIVVGTSGDTFLMRERAVLWRGGGSAVPLGRPAGARRTVPTGISDDGVIAGFADYPDGRIRGVFWSAAVPASVRLLDEGVELTGISPAGAVTGATGPAEGQRAVAGRAGALRPLPAAGPSDRATAAAGTWTVGRTSAGAEGDRAVLWEGRTPWLLRGTLAEATAVNADGLVAGLENTRAAVWRDGVLTLLPGGGEASAVTDAGQVAGRQQDRPTTWTCA